MRRPSKSQRDDVIPQRRTCCGVIEEATYKAREKRVNRIQAQPWIVLKLMVGFTFGIMAYTAYVYIGRFCVGMIRRLNGGSGSRGVGITLLVIFSILFLWMMWAYIKVISTPPGHARDHAPRSSRPVFSEPQHLTSYRSYEHDLERNRQLDSSVVDDTRHEMSSIGGPSYENIPVRSTQEQTENEHSIPKEILQEPSAGVLDALPHPHPVKTDDGAASKSSLRPKRLKKPSVYIDRRPPMIPVLLPEHRYCSIDEIVKPYRTHHCRSCGTCILKYDHHCPWIGQCVGARNQKFFLNFVQVASIFTLYTFATLIAYTVRAANAGGDIDPQQIVIIALAAVFALFTVSLQISHIHLIWMGQTTVESMQTRSQREREDRALRDAFGFCGILDKRRVRRTWDEEWGAIGKEGNMWWLGSGKRGWVDVMGRNPWGWFLPIGRSLNDGLTYPVNPRFDSQGRWRRRIEWPKELQ